MKTAVGNYDITILEQKNYGYFEHSNEEIEGGLMFLGSPEFKEAVSNIFDSDYIDLGIAERKASELPFKENMK